MTITTPIVDRIDRSAILTSGPMVFEDGAYMGLELSRAVKLGGSFRHQLH